MKKFFSILVLVFILSSCSLGWSVEINNDTLSGSVEIGDTVLTGSVNGTGSTWTWEEVLNDEKVWTWEELTQTWEIIQEDKKDVVKEKVLEYNSVSVSNWDYCVLDVCLNNSVNKIEDKWDKYVQLFGDYYNGMSYEKYPQSYSVYKKDWSYIKKVLEASMASEYVEVHKYDNYYSKVNVNASCAWFSIKQSIFDLLGNSIDKSIPELKSGISAWNYTWNLKLNFEGKTNLYQDDTLIIKDRKFASSDEMYSYMKEQIYNKDTLKRKIKKRYVFELNNWLYALYEANFEQPNRIVFLWTDVDRMKNAVNWEADFMDFDLTQKIVWYYWENSWEGIMNSDWKRITNITKANLPLFKVKKFDDNWYFILYIKSPYTIQFFAEMCKPAVYIYDKNKSENTLSIDYENGSYFTKVIPDFTSKDSWKFTWNNWDVEVKGESYDYLYYAIMVKWYEHNENGWIVAWENISKFFNDKLDKINFNEKEKKDFLEYWLPKYEAGKYYFVSFKYKEDLDKMVDLSFKNKPNVEFRVLLDSYELDAMSSDKERFLYSNVWDSFDKYLIKRFDRWNSDYEVFEWGGVLEKNGEYFIY